MTRRGSKRRTMKKSVWGVATFAALALSLSACGADPAATEPEPATDAEGEEAPEIEGDGSEIIIGGSLCLTGIQAPLDEPIMRGVEQKSTRLNSSHVAAAHAVFGVQPHLPTRPSPS